MWGCNVESKVTAVEVHKVSVWGAVCQVQCGDTRLLCVVYLASCTAWSPIAEKGHL